ncbi:hypothetical protein, partial [Klebsiella pneumoniae]|uniref:hypothetical protein n=1 Tax=Klebsiella pneumoniae TaxID=573 RepID=UPI002731230B
GEFDIRGHCDGDVVCVCVPKDVAQSLSQYSLGVLVDPGIHQSVDGAGELDAGGHGGLGGGIADDIEEASSQARRPGSSGSLQIEDRCPDL